MLLCRLARLVHPVEYLKAPADALDRLLREVLLPLYLHRQHNLAAAPDRKQGKSVPKPFSAGLVEKGGL